MGVEDVILYKVRKKEKGKRKKGKGRREKE
jgi:hypothetical protein